MDGTSAFLAQAAAALQRKPDDSDGFTIVVTNKLKIMRTEQRQLAEMLFLKVLHKGVNDKLTKKTHLEEQQAFLAPTPSVPPIVSQPLQQQGTHWQYAPGERPQWSHDYTYAQL